MSFFSRLFGQREEQYIAEPVHKGDTVRIIDGAFTDYVGEVTEINEQTKRVKVMVMMFGTDTPIEVRLVQVEKQQ